MRWGIDELWGVESLWGIDQFPQDKEFCALADERVLVQMDDTGGNRKFRDFLCCLVGPLGIYTKVADDVKIAFDINFAQGVQLDMIGAVIGLPRQGFGDTRYRVFLQIQIQLILAASREGADWTGTHNNILAICRTFIGPGEPLPVVLTNTPPYAFRLDVPGVAIDEIDLLIRFVCIAIYAGVLGSIAFSLGPDSLWDSVHGPVTGGGIFCSVHGPVPGCAVFGTVRPIGLCPA